MANPKLSKIDIKGEFITKFQDKQFLYFAERSRLGILLIQRGYLLYYNKEFGKIFGYTQEEISKWKKREFYKIVHPEDLQKLLQKFQIKGDKTAIVQFRGIRKDGSIIPIENSVCIIKYNGINAYLSTYIRLDDFVKDNSNLGKKEDIKISTDKDKKNLLIELEISNNMELIIQNILEFFKKNNMKVIKLIKLIN